MKFLSKGFKSKNLILLILSVFVLRGLTACSSYCANQDTVDDSMFSTPPARGCKVYSPSPDPSKDVPFKLRAETQTEDGISVSAVVLSDEESERVFGANLAGNGIQPVWLDIHNTRDKPITLIYVATDPGYYSPNEAAYTNYSYASPVNDEMNEYFNRHSIKREIPAGGVLSGFFYTNWDPGIKYLNVSLYGEDQEKNFVFYFVIPGIKLDYQRVDWDSLYKKDEYVNYGTEEELRKALEAVPCCATRKDGTGKNDALNFFVIGDTDNIVSAFIRRGWDVTEPISASSGWRAFKAYFSGARYRTSPMSSIYVFKRAQDIGLQKARSTIHERNHLRLWLMPIRYKGMDVWIGSVSRDVGSYFTFRTPWLSAHAIDPDIDEARTYLVQDLLFSGGVEKFGYIKGIKPATPDNPHRNFMKQPWWTDGYRAVFLFGDQPVTLNEVKFFDWEWAGEDNAQFLEFLKSQSEHGTKAVSD
ncbi:MAG TPA: LssY C-terminal domain-containing protein [Thermodesulfobacteriota bacterium]|nr:LssY C-terminal domain-containing protein [Thermodesulfobacteriota bacterium]